MEFIFEWDESKAKTNRQKHDVNFTEAKTVFNDPFLITYPDTKHSEVEDRFISVGLSANGRTLIVIHIERRGNIRIISARKATNTERKHYEERI